MTPQQLADAVTAATNEIIGLKKSCRRQYGTSDKARDCKWPPHALAKLDQLRADVKKYQEMLKDLA